MISNYYTFVIGQVSLQVNDFFIQLFPFRVFGIFCSLSSISDYIILKLYLQIFILKLFLMPCGSPPPTGPKKKKKEVCKWKILDSPLCFPPVFHKVG